MATSDKADGRAGKTRSKSEATDAGADRPTTGVFSVVRERWLAGGMLGFAVVTGALWVLQPSQDGRSITAALRDGARAAPSGVSAQLPDPVAVGRRISNGMKRPGDDGSRGVGTQVARLSSGSVDALESRFERLDYSLQKVRAQQIEVPRIVPETVPHDLAEVNEVSRKKSVFLQMVLPLVLMANERLVEQRQRIEGLRAELAAGERIDAAERRWLERMFDSYKLADEDFSLKTADFDTLLLRVDVVPPSLALAQAAIESGWGTSRFAREGNALFGQWVWGDEANGIVPEQRQDGKTHKIRAFETPLEAVAAYIKNLNTHRAYRKLRVMRADLRAQGAGLNGLTLAGGLESYSEKGMAYVELVRQIISANKLRPLDKARLANRAPSNV